jgi:hypothetical protein
LFGRDKLMFDDTFVINRIAEVWKFVFTNLSLNPDYIYQNQDLRSIAQANVPSVYIRKLSGIINQANHCGTKESRGNKTDFKLLRLWNREIMVRTTILGYLKNEANPDYLYTGRLLSLFLREFEQGPVMDVGSNDPVDHPNDQLRQAVIGSISESKSEINELDGRLIEKLDITIPVQFYEYFKLI